MSRIICLSPNYIIVTLEDDLHGTRAKHNQVKSMSARKAEKEVHTADTILRRAILVHFSNTFSPSRWV